MNIIILTCFLAGYLLIALEGKTRINKASVALVTCTVCWMLLGDTLSHEQLSSDFQAHLAECCQTVLFLLAAMIVVEMLDSCGSFQFVARKLRTSSIRALLWKTTLITFCLSAVLDNMTTTILMVTILRGIVADHRQRMLLACTVVLAANAGGAFSPIGDVTTIMLWIGGNVSGPGIVKGLLLPSVVCVLVPTLAVATRMHGQIQPTAKMEQPTCHATTGRHKLLILCTGVSGLALTPVFHNLTGLPPFMGVMGVMAILWIIIELNVSATSTLPDPRRILGKTDLPTILFFLGILLAVGALKETGMLEQAGQWLETQVGNVYVVNALIGIVSSVIDNVPLVASTMSMYSIDAAGTLSPYCQDGAFWELLAYCAGTGGSLLIIGSAAGVVAMGIERISFVWYLRHFTPLAFTGYLCGLGTHWLLSVL